MRFSDFYKKAVFYYIFVPVCLSIWPVMVALVYLPQSKKAQVTEQKTYSDMNDVMFSILTLDPDRAKGTSAQNSAGTFVYAVAINATANACGILNPKINALPERKKIQDADITLQGVGIEAFANFMFTLQRRWAALECQSIVLEKQKALANNWLATLKFRYYF